MVDDKGLATNVFALFCCILGFPNSLYIAAEGFFSHLRLLV